VVNTKPLILSIYGRMDIGIRMIDDATLVLISTSLYFMGVLELSDVANKRRRGCVLVTYYYIMGVAV
jgi:hypothetical protein